MVAGVPRLQLLNHETLPEHLHISARPAWDSPILQAEVVWLVWPVWKHSATAEAEHSIWPLNGANRALTGESALDSSKSHLPPLCTFSDTPAGSSPQSMSMLLEDQVNSTCACMTWESARIQTEPQVRENSQVPLCPLLWPAS